MVAVIVAFASRRRQARAPAPAGGRGGTREGGSVRPAERWSSALQGGKRVAIEIEINREVCMGSGNCSFWAPGVFDLDDDGIAFVVDPAGSPEDKILLAVQGCPTQAIRVVTT
jgi:ferredoxin